MKIYTKKGDKGETGLLGGTRVKKSHIRIESYGTVDELNSWIGLIRDQNIDKHSKEILIHIQDRLFTIGSHLASDPAKSKAKIPDIKEEDITILEKEIDKMNESLPEMRSFVLPGGHTIASYCHIARCVCRRAERCSVRLASEEKVDDSIIKYLNRLSDYLFVLSRKLTKDLKAKEVPWKPSL
ncbi:MAG: cob(I)yrinic acid a,c-diamide adenosyltransferase [Bacteroidetes bacterium]|nr:MAG: cob(I)yrinic acid a,c-diamide adenosyltransferase [Bacteroidota bacterium]